MTSDLKSLAEEKDAAELKLVAACLHGKADGIIAAYKIVIERRAAFLAAVDAVQAHRTEILEANERHLKRFIEDQRQITALRAQMERMRKAIEEYGCEWDNPAPDYSHRAFLRQRMRKIAALSEQPTGEGR